MEIWHSVKKVVKWDWICCDHKHITQLGKAYLPNPIGMKIYSTEYLYDQLRQVARNFNTNKRTINNFKIYTSFGTLRNADRENDESHMNLVETMQCDSFWNGCVPFAIWIIRFGQCVQNAVSNMAIEAKADASMKRKADSAQMIAKNLCYSWVRGQMSSCVRMHTMFARTVCFNWKWHCRKPFCTIVYVTHSF